MQSTLPVTAVHFASVALNDDDQLHPCLVVGAGPDIHLHPTEARDTHSQCRALPTGVRVHRILSLTNDLVAVAGGRYISLIKLSPKPRLLLRKELVEWIFDIAVLENELFVALGHGCIAALNRETLDMLRFLPPKHREMSWSAGLHVSENSILVGHGTSFGHIVLRELHTSLSDPGLKPEVLHGHAGAVTQLRFSKDASRLVASSVDRTVRIWNRANTSYVTHLVHFGHTARVWDVVFVDKERVASVGEDRTVRIWSATASGEHISHTPHDGRNVWCVDYCDGRLATGGDDTAVKIRTLSSSADKIQHLEYPLPDKYRSPRKTQGATTNEGVRSLVLTPKFMYLGTDFGRLLKCTLCNLDEPQFTVLFRDEKGTAFAPGALTCVGNILLAGRSDGELLALDTENGHQTSFPATGPEKTMIMGVLGVETENGIDAYVMKPSGEAVRWVLSRTLQSTRSCSFLQIELKRNMLVTSALHIPNSQLLVTGDRGGRITIYQTSDEKNVIQNPACFLRPHSDRVSALYLLETSTSPTSCRYVVLSAGFDGRTAKIKIDVTLSEETQPKIAAHLLSNTRTLDRADTIARVFYPIHNGKPMHERPCVVGFRSTDAILCDLLERNVLFRSDCGNWRRAFDISADITQDEHGSLTVHKIFFAYWRGGKLIVETTGSSQKQVQTITPPFHGLRVNSMCAVGNQNSNEVCLLTAGEDTVVRVVKQSIHGLKTQQVLSKHVSGVYDISISKVGSEYLAVSGGGCDEAVLWAANAPEGPWKCVSLFRVNEAERIANGIKWEKEHDETTANHRVLSVECLPTEVYDSESRCLMVVLGRTDGSVVLVTCYQDNNRWKMREVARVYDSRGAVMCLTTVLKCTELFVLAGDSAGYVCVWQLTTNSTSNNWAFRLAHRILIHPGGVLCIDSGIAHGSPLYVSGGDDGCVKIFRLDEEKVSELTERTVSAAGITGVCVSGNEVVAVAMCQRVWRWRVGKTLEATALERREDTEVCDPAKVVRVGNQVYVCGHGLEEIEGLV